MSEPTLSDVLSAIGGVRSQLTTQGTVLAALEARVVAVEAKLDAVDAKVDAVDAKLDAHRAETAKHRAETAKAFADIDRELTLHTTTHREIERRFEALERRPTGTGGRRPRRR